jgi:hypothetical protein
MGPVWGGPRTGIHWLENRETVRAVEISGDVVRNEQAGGGTHGLRVTDRSRGPYPAASTGARTRYGVSGKQVVSYPVEKSTKSSVLRDQLRLRGSIGMRAAGCVPALHDSSPGLADVLLPQ